MGKAAERAAERLASTDKFLTNASKSGKSPEEKIKDLLK